MDGDADVLIRAHLGPDEAGTRISTANPRIILVSHIAKDTSSQFGMPGPPPLTVDTAIFEMWLGSLSRHKGLAIPVV